MNPILDDNLGRFLAYRFDYRFNNNHKQMPAI